MPNWAYYLTLAIFFFSVISFSIWAMLFANWLTLGPKFKHKVKQILNKIKGKEKAEGVLINKGEVSIQASYLDDINKQIDNAQSPQELLELQFKKEQIENAAKKAKEDIAKAEAAKLEKINSKKEKKEIQKEADEIAKKLKEEEKQKRAEIKQAKKEKK